MSPATIALALRYGAMIGEYALRGLSAAAEARDLIDQLTAEGRDPTGEEWSRIAALTDQLHAEIQRA